MVRKGVPLSKNCVWQCWRIAHTLGVLELFLKMQLRSGRVVAAAPAPAPTPVPTPAVPAPVPAPVQEVQEVQEVQAQYQRPPGGEPLVAVLSETLEEYLDDLEERLEEEAHYDRSRQAQAELSQLREFRSVHSPEEYTRELLQYVGLV